ncbi:hypothetical protein ACFWIQ_34220 [Kitasatospora sp. NPDC127059]|uniref:hypothetical protein n=1 Tax=unclassified Kitasatospora TaxID=2633591 RepID=UPI00364E985F
MPDQPAHAPRGRTAAAAAAGLVAGLLLAGIPLLLTGSGGDGDAPATAAAFGGLGETLHAPDRLPGGFTPLTAGADAKLAENAAADEAGGTRTLSQAYGGAAAAVRQYADDGMRDFLVLEAVRAASPKPYTPYADPAPLGQAKPNSEVVTIGQVSCLVFYQPVLTGEQVTPDKTNVQLCERTSAHLTVRLRFAGAQQLQHDTDQAAHLTDQAWSTFP